MNLATVALNAVEYIVAVVALSAAFFLHETEEGRLESALIEMWLRIANQADTTRKRFAWALHGSTQISLRVLDRVFGKRLVSWQAIGVSNVFALASFLLIFGLQRHGIEALRAGIVALVMIGIAVAPAICRDPEFKWALVLTSIMALAGLGIQLLVATTRPVDTDSRIVKIAVLASIAAAPIVDFGWLVAWRRGTLWASTRPGIIAPAALIVVGAVLAAASCLLPLSFVWLESHATAGPAARLLGYFVLSVAATRLFLVVISLSQLLVLLTSMIHWALWPPLSRIVYSAERFRVFSNRKLLASLGAALLVHAAGGSGWIVSTFKVLGIAP